MGNFCMKDNRAGDSEFKVEVKSKDVPNIIRIQSVLRGFLDRKKTVDYNCMKFRTRSLGGKSKPLPVKGK